MSQSSTNRVRRKVGLGLGALALAAALLPLPPAFVERVYSAALYPLLQHVLTAFSNRVPFALLDVLLIVLAIWSAVGWVGWLRAATRGRWAGATIALMPTVVGVAGVLYLSFFLTWGLNYRRQPLTQRLDFDERRVTADALRNLARQTVWALNGLHAPATRLGWPDLEDVPHTLATAFTRVRAQVPSMPAVVPGRPKRSVLGWYFRRAAIDGMIDPFFLEPLVNEGILPFERPFVVAHEWAHLAGYARESEASFLGWLTCQAGDSRAQYSGWLFLGPHLWGALPVGERTVILAALQDGPRRDLEAVAARLARASPLARRAAWRVYDSFLRAHRVEGGVASYGEVVRLVLGSQVGSAD